MSIAEQNELVHYEELSAFMDAEMADYFEWYYRMGYVYDPESDEAIREMMEMDARVASDLDNFPGSKRRNYRSDYDEDGRYGWRTTGMRDGAMVW